MLRTHHAPGLLLESLDASIHKQTKALPSWSLYSSRGRCWRVTQDSVDAQCTSACGPCLVGAALVTPRATPAVPWPPVPPPITATPIGLGAICEDCAHVSRSWVCPKASRLVPVLRLSSPTLHAGGFPAAAEVRDLLRANPNPFSHHAKYKNVNAHGADFDQWETDTEGYIFSSFLGTLFGDALASFNLFADVL